MSHVDRFYILSAPDARDGFVIWDSVTEANAQFALRHVPLTFAVRQDARRMADGLNRGL